MKVAVKIFAAVGFGLAAAIVGQVAFNAAGSADAALGWPTLVLGALGALVGWHRA